ncbi:DNA polymerase alpha/epsilon subunit B-domain-containing protein [Gorgonomyces haynaldii]|nr:DNA polymerase alpha/epsilon subunit B-domain-containing protein [Gorgonomyces haynaldii]
METTGFTDRINSGEAMDEFNPQIPKDLPALDLPSACAVALVPGQQTQGYRYMYEKLTEKGDLLNDRINYFARLMALDRMQLLEGAEMDEKPEEVMDYEKRALSLIAPLMQPRQDLGFYVGRVCCDALGDDISMNEMSLVLETSRELGGGGRVSLNLEPLRQQNISYSLFPGQVIGVEATNPSGTCLNVSNVYLPESLPVPTSNTADLKQIYSGDTNRPVHIVTVAGPYVLPSVLDFEPLEAFVRTMESNPPDVIIMLGPFIDIEHESIEQGLTEQSPEEIFKQHITPRLQRLSQSRQCLSLVLIPSNQDAITEYVAFPQPPIGAGLSPQESVEKLVELGLDRVPNLFLFPNPVQFTINELVCATSTLDILFHMNRNRVHYGKDEDLIAQQFENMMQQRSFCPLYPPANGFHFDSSRALLLGEENGPCQLLVKPDLMIVPSRLKQSARAVGGTLCVNPGYLLKHGKQGTYSRIVVHPFELPEGDDVLEHSLTERSNVQVLKI